MKVTKSFSPDQIRPPLFETEKNRFLEQRLAALEGDVASAQPPIDSASSEPAVQRAQEAAFKAASGPAPILLLGPVGSGKSVLAREIHRRSPQREGAFVTLACAGLSRETIEGELFGRSAAAEGGTLFLHEIGALPLEVQPKVVRLLQPVDSNGGSEARRNAVRVVAASSRDLAAESRAGRFRSDLFHRLNIGAIVLPPLRERPADIARLAEADLAFFARRAGRRLTGLAPETLQAFARYAWPGNLRELSNVLERAAMLATGPLVGLESLPDEFAASSKPDVAVGAKVSLEVLEGEHIRRLIESCSSLEETARTLGIDPATLYRKRQKLGLR